MGAEYKGYSYPSEEGDQYDYARFNKEEVEKVTDNPNLSPFEYLEAIHSVDTINQDEEDRPISTYDPINDGQAWGSF